VSNPSDIVTTTGINSSVLDGDECVGHILLADYDEQGSFNKLRQETATLPGINALFRSSPGSFHVWNLSVRSKDETALLKLELHDDDKHNSIGYRKNRWTLRVAQKSIGEDQYKEPPELIDVWSNPTDDYPQSRPHWAMLQAIAERQDYGEIEKHADLVAWDWAGDRHEVESYLSITDSMKEKIKEADKQGR